MRKFTKEISALLASVAVGASLSAGTASSVDYAVSEGVAMNPDAVNEEEVFFDGVDMPEPTTVPLAGEPMPPDDYIEPTTEEFPPLGGVPMISDEYIETPVTTVMTTLPPLAGTTVPTTTTTTTTTTAEEFPPLAGELAPADGDINGDGQFNIADVVSIQKYILNSSVAKLSNWYAADFNYDGKLDVFDVVEMRKTLIRNNEVPVINENKNSIMTAKVVEIREYSILVKPENKKGGLISVNNDVIQSDIKVGDTVEIEYDGKIMETDPAQIRAYKVTLVESATRDLLNEYQLVRVGYASEYIPCDNSKELEIKTEKHLPIKACTSYAEFKELFLFIDDNFSTNYGFDGDNSFDEAIERYNDEFFDNNALLVAEVKAGSGSYIHAVKSVELNEDSGITVRISQKKPEVATCDMADWIFLISIPKDSVEGCSVDAVLLD